MKEHDVYFCGRLAEYKYYDMDVVIGNALEFAKSVLFDKSPNIAYKK